MPQDEAQVDRRKIRIGLVMVSIVVVVALVLVALVDSPFARAIMFAIAVSAFVRAFLIVRSLRRPAP
jgi:hypothetical protein